MFFDQAKFLSQWQSGDGTVAFRREKHADGGPPVAMAARRRYIFRVNRS